MFQFLFRAATDQLAFEDPHSAHTLRHGSPHWIRHAAITHIANTTQKLKLAQQFACHAKLGTTAMYLHVDERARYERAAALKLPTERPRWHHNVGASPDNLEFIPAKPVRDGSGGSVCEESVS